jgi:hypothetical protein
MTAFQPLKFREGSQYRTPPTNNKGDQHMSTTDPILPAQLGTTLLHFAYFVSSKASINQVLERTVRRPVLFWVLKGDRLFPIAVAMPILEDLETFVGSEVVLIPGNAIYDPLTGESWPNADAWGAEVVKRWGSWLKSNAPPPVAVPPTSQRIGVVTPGGIGSYVDVPLA